MKSVYKVTAPNGTIIESGCSVIDAAEIVLTYDSTQYEIRQCDDSFSVENEKLFSLWSKRLNGKWDCVSSVKPVYAIDADSAWPAIAANVVEICNTWRNSPCVDLED